MNKNIKKTVLGLFVLLSLIIGIVCLKKNDDPVMIKYEKSVASDDNSGDSYQNEDGIKDKEEESKKGAEDEVSAADNVNNPIKEEQKILVHVCGAVNMPGVYELSEGSRIFEAVNMAGGFSLLADEDFLNLAQGLSDGMKIYVPTTQESESGLLEASYDGANDSDKGLININTAGREELMTLTGVGQSKADSIIAYREEMGPFESIEQIMNIPGIKSGLFNKICDKITV